MNVFPALLLFAAIVAPESSPESPAAPAIGAAVPNLTLKDIHRRPRSLADYAAKRATVVVFLGTECPLANQWVPTLVELHRQFADQGVQFLAINANRQDSFVEVSAHAQERAIPFPVLKDFDQRAADAFGAKRTPEAFVLDAQRKIRYHGRIDDQFGVGTARDKPTKRELHDAIVELLADKPISVPTTEIAGCIIGRANSPRIASEVTFAKQVSRIVQDRCQKCHREGQIGPMALETYDDVKSWAETIREVVLEQRMPPWHANSSFGEFSNERRLTADETDVLLDWVDRGCVRGDDKDLPTPLPPTAAWTIGKPDRIFTMTTEYAVPASGVIDYQRFTLDPGFSEDVWVQAAECQPGNRAVVHHILVYISEPGKQIYAPDGTAATLAGWAPGDMPVTYPAGTARRIPAGAKLVFEVHYTPNGTPQTDRSSVGVVFAKSPPKRAVEVNILANIRLRVPPATANYQGQMSYTFPRDAQVLSFMPHLHLRGIGAKYVATYPDGRSETLLFVPDYDFNWQSVYRFKRPLELPKGTKLTLTSWWDNSADNPRNPDPTKTVKWGEQTWDEMQNGWMDLVWTD